MGQPTHVLAAQLLLQQRLALVQPAEAVDLVLVLAPHLVLLLLVAGAGERGRRRLVFARELKSPCQLAVPPQDRVACLEELPFVVASWTVTLWGNSAAGIFSLRAHEQTVVSLMSSYNVLRPVPRHHPLPRHSSQFHASPTSFHDGTTTPPAIILKRGTCDPCH